MEFMKWNSGEWDEWKLLRLKAVWKPKNQVRTIFQKIPYFRTFPGKLLASESDQFFADSIKSSNANSIYNKLLDFHFTVPKTELCVDFWTHQPKWNFYQPESVCHVHQMMCQTSAIGGGVQEGKEEWYDHFPDVSPWRPNRTCCQKLFHPLISLSSFVSRFAWLTNFTVCEYYIHV